MEPEVCISGYTSKIQKLLRLISKQVVKKLFKFKKEIKDFITLRLSNWFQKIKKENLNYFEKAGFYFLSCKIKAPD